MVCRRDPSVGNVVLCVHGDRRSQCLVTKCVSGSVPFCVFQLSVEAAILPKMTTYRTVLVFEFIKTVITVTDTGRCWFFELIKP